MGAIGVIFIPLIIATFRAVQRMEASDAKHQLTAQRLSYIEADGLRQDARLGRIETMLMQVRDGVIEMKADMKK
jgi:hypothetical protein